MKALGETFYSKYILGKKFLTPRPWGDAVHPAQPVKLWYMPVESRIGYLILKTYFSDNSYDTRVTEINFSTDKLYEINCNPVIH